MNFVKETDRFVRQLEAWKKGHGFSDREALQQLANIWDEFKNIPENKKVIYGNAKAQPPKTDMGCSNCIADMLQFVWNWRKHLEHDVSTYFQGVPQAEVVEAKDQKPALKMHELRSLAKKKGIHYTNKTTAAELNELLNAGK